VRFLETLAGVIVTAGLIYLAFIIGGFVLRVLFGLLAIAVVVYLLTPSRRQVLGAATRVPARPRQAWRARPTPSRREQAA